MIVVGWFFVSLSLVLALLGFVAGVGMMSVAFQLAARSNHSCFMAVAFSFITMVLSMGLMAGGILLGKVLL